MTPLLERDARFWMKRLRPVERLVWVGRPRLTIRMGWPVIVAAGPAALYAAFYLWHAMSGPQGATLGEILTDWSGHGIEFFMIAALAWCLFYFLRHGLIFPFQQRYAVTDRRLMVWRHGRSPALVDEEIDLSLRLRRPARPRNSVLFSKERLFARGSQIAGYLPARAAERPVGFLNVADSEGMETALAVVLDGMEERAWR
ncbi:hypothetical protein [Tropicimonas sp. IMCC6043]|uniref:hypothetical protein n=1 Tax=Tropicimonas sp. IMCC6043 TaxID=2510645 RepID=UPI00101DF5F3|nr:hypothetical protein [Tropicimonas sp. IMCC6043]RYH10912.1 hypothetical protein EU800_06575 [Tropicimonas sp. IMCC6043]